MYIHFFLESDHPTLAQLITFVLPIDDVAANWSQISNRLVRRSFSMSTRNEHQNCIEILKMWTEDDSATWSTLFGVLHSIGLHTAVGKLYRLLQGMFHTNCMQ